MSASQSAASRLSAWILARLPKSFTKDGGEDRSGQLGACLVCHAYLPFVFYDGLLYVQAPFGCLLQETSAKMCPWRDLVEAGVTEEW